MKRDTFNVMFFIKRKKLLKNGEAPIYARMTINGQCAEFGLKRSIPEKLWNQVKGCANSKSQIGKEINQYIEHVKYRIFEVHKSLLIDNQHISARLLVDTLLDKNQGDKTLTEAFTYIVDRFEKLIGVDYVPATIQKYRTTYMHLGNFLKQEIKSNDILLNNVDVRFINNFEFYLKTTKKIGHNTAIKYISILGRVLNICVTNKWMNENPVKKVTLKKQQVDKSYLTPEELQAIIEKEISIECLAKTRDVFIFACLTGLAFSDIKGLTNDHLIKGHDGKTWIRKKRQKTKILSHFPLLDIPAKILKRYENYNKVNPMGYVLPVNSNQKMNAYLKEIADLCGIKKELTTHTARHTFATTVTLANKVSMEAVSKMLGHADIKMTKQYARIVDSLVSDETGGFNSVIY